MPDSGPSYGAGTAGFVTSAGVVGGTGPGGSTRGTDGNPADGTPPDGVPAGGVGGGNLTDEAVCGSRASRRSSRGGRVTMAEPAAAVALVAPGGTRVGVAGMCSGVIAGGCGGLTSVPAEGTRSAGPVSISREAAGTGVSVGADVEVADRCDQTQ